MVVVVVAAAAIEDRSEYHTHHLVYDAHGALQRGGEERVAVAAHRLSAAALQYEQFPTRATQRAAAALPPLTAAQLQAEVEQAAAAQPTATAEYVIPGVYKRNDQIILSMLYFTGRYGIRLDHSAQLWQSMHLAAAAMHSQLAFRPYHAPPHLLAAPPLLPGVAPDSDPTAAPTLRLYNAITQSFPTFIHYNGPAKDWTDRGPLTYRVLAYGATTPAGSAQPPQTQTHGGLWYHAWKQRVFEHDRRLPELRQLPGQSARQPLVPALSQWAADRFAKHFVFLARSLKRIGTSADGVPPPEQRFAALCPNLRLW